MLTPVRRLPICVFLFVLSAALAVGRAEAANPLPADVVVADAKIYTADRKRSMAEALAIPGRKLIDAGDALRVPRFIGPTTQVKRLGGRLVRLDYIRQRKQGMPDEIG